MRCTHIGKVVLLCGQVLAEAQGMMEAWPPAGVLPIAAQLVCGGEPAVLPALRAYLACRQRPTRSAPGPSGSPDAPTTSGRCVPCPVLWNASTSLSCMLWEVLSTC